jgi:hypothetical protein
MWPTERHIGRNSSTVSTSRSQTQQTLGFSTVLFFTVSQNTSIFNCSLIDLPIASARSTLQCGIAFVVREINKDDKIKDKIKDNVNFMVNRVDFVFVDWLHSTKCPVFICIRLKKSRGSSFYSSMYLARCFNLHLHPFKKVTRVIVFGDLFIEFFSSLFYYSLRHVLVFTIVLLVFFIVLLVVFISS